MKKIFIIMLMCCLFITGCSSSKNIKKNVINKYSDSNGYKLKGNLSITNNDDIYNYNVEVGYKKDKYYKVMLTNLANNHVQVILKNDDGVYVVTPSLNKSFKFQSDWPYNNSQVYLLNAISSDIKDDEKAKFKKENNKYIINTKVKYSNNSNLIKQKLEFDKKLNIKKATVYDNDGIAVITMIFDSIKFNPKFGKNYFSLDSVIDNNIKSNNSENESTNKKSNINNDNSDNTSSNSVTKDSEESTNKSTSGNDIKSQNSTNSSSKNTSNVGSLDDVIYPLFLPSGTKLVNEEKVNKDTGERVIMTYDGEKSFLLVEETSDVFDEFTIIPSSGEPFQLIDTLGVMTDNSLSWESNNKEYYLVSDVMSKDEMVEVARSIGNVSSLK